MKLAITAIFQNESNHLKEWIDFHLLMGAEHFYLFDHFSTDGPEKVLKPYIEKNLVSLIRWPIEYSNVNEWTLVQCLAYERALFWAKTRVKWLALLDVDEYLFSTKGKLIDHLDAYDEFGGIAVNWQIFGTSNIKKIPQNTLLIEALTKKAKTTQVTNHYVKSIVRPERVKACENAHSMTYIDGYFQVTPSKKPFKGCLSPDVEVELLRINHYTLRDETYLHTQKLPRLQRWWNKASEMDRYHEMNEVEDREIHRFIPLLLKDHSSGTL